VLHALPGGARDESAESFAVYFKTDDQVIEIRDEVVCLMFSILHDFKELVLVYQALLQTKQNATETCKMLKLVFIEKTMITTQIDD
jgi:hypothetical protein